MASVREHIQGVLKRLGIKEASAVQVLFDNGDTVMVVSNDNPALDRPASQVKETKVMQSASAGA